MRIHVLVLALVALLASGCFVDDLLDDANSKVGEHTEKTGSDAKSTARRGKGRAAPPASASTPQPGSEEEEDQGPGWWETARTVSANERPSEIVECSVSGRNQFMKRGDCLSRGGVVR